MNSTYCNIIKKGLFVSHRGVAFCCVNPDKQAMKPSEFWYGKDRAKALDAMSNANPVKGCDQCYADEKNKNTSVRLSKHNIFLRDQFVCQYCEQQLPHKNKCTVDHVIPISRGGRTTWENCVTACGPCNVAKGDKLSPKPTRYPFKPTYYDLIKNKEYLNLKLKHASWNNYIA